ncbi:mediator of DNA damage checkpoint protein 1-like [Amblyraja radiata]|uniref:mediator of DNA damage checkpoint protein 1-like n=1 Tax=Amblyraja radiata TaxID=386614 RepID=UPI001401FBD6|nr:mediator of DNA damage checkpoint protein 1-like [Amblyraja radiata]
MESEAVDSCIQRSLSALYPPFEETAATLLAQVFDVLEKIYQHDALRYIIDFFIPAKHILQTIQQQACEPYGGRRFAHAGWPLCQRGLVVVQLAALDWRQLRPGDFYLQLAPRQAGRGARLLLRWPGPEGPGSEPVPEASYPHLFTAEWLDGVNRRHSGRGGGGGGGLGLEWCLAAEGGRLKRLPWRRVVYPLLEPEDGPEAEAEAGPRPPAIGTRRRPSGDGADAEPRTGAEAGLKRSLGNGQDWSWDNDAPDGEASTYCSVTACGLDDNDDHQLQDGDEGEYVELLEASAHARGCPRPRPRPRRACALPASRTASLPAAAGRRRPAGTHARARRGAWQHRRRRRRGDSGGCGGGGGGGGGTRRRSRTSSNSRAAAEQATPLPGATGRAEVEGAGDADAHAPEPPRPEAATPLDGELGHVGPGSGSALPLAEEERAPGRTACRLDEEACPSEMRPGHPLAIEGTSAMATGLSLAGREGSPTLLAGREGSPTPLAGREGSPTPLAGREGSPTLLAGREGSPTPLAGREGSPTPLAGREGSPTLLAGREESPTPLAGREGSPTLLAGREGSLTLLAGREGSPTLLAGREGSPMPLAANEQSPVPLAGDGSPQNGGRLLTPDPCPKPASRRPLPDRSSPKPTSQRHSRKFGSDPSLDQWKTGIVPSPAKRVLPNTLPGMSLPRESERKTGTKHSMAVIKLPKTRTKTFLVEEIAATTGPEHSSGQQTLLETGTQQLLAEQRPPASGTRQSLDAQVKSRMTTDQSLSQQPAMAIGTTPPLDEYMGSELTNQSTTTSGIGPLLAGQDQVTSRTQQPLADEAAPRPGREQPLAEQTALTGDSLAESVGPGLRQTNAERDPARTCADRSHSANEQSAVRTQPLVAATGSRISLVDCPEGDRLNSLPQSSGLEVNYSGPTITQTAECCLSQAHTLVDQTERPTSPPEEARGDCRWDGARPTGAGELPTPNVRGLSSEREHHGGEEARWPDGVTTAAPVHNLRGEQRTSGEAREREGLSSRGHPAEVSQREHSSDSTEEGSPEVDVRRGRGGGRDSPCQPSKQQEELTPPAQQLPEAPPPSPSEARLPGPSNPPPLGPTGAPPPHPPHPPTRCPSTAPPPCLSETLLPDPSDPPLPDPTDASPPHPPHPPTLLVPPPCPTEALLPGPSDLPPPGSTDTPLPSPSQSPPPGPTETPLPVVRLPILSDTPSPGPSDTASPGLVDVPPPHPPTTPSSCPSDVPTEDPSPGLSLVPLPQLPDAPICPPTQAPSPPHSEANSPSTLAPSPRPSEAPLPQPSDIPSPRPTEAPSPQLSDIPSPRLPDTPSHQVANIPSPQLSEAASPEPRQESPHRPSDASSNHPTSPGRGDIDAATQSHPRLLDPALPSHACTTTLLEVDLDVLQSEVLSLPGSRDRSGRALVILMARNPILHKPTCSSTQLARILMYLHAISRKDLQERGLRVLMESHHHWPAAVIWKAFDIFQGTVPGGIHSILVLTGKESPIVKEGPRGSQVKVVSSILALHEYVDPAQLTEPFGGSFQYNHQKWARFRQSLESLSGACRTSILFLRSTRHQLEAKRLPHTLEEVAVLIEEDQTLMRQVLQDTRLTGLQQEGAAILGKLKREMATNSEDYRDAMKTTCALYDQVDEEVHRLVQVSNQRLKDLESLAQFWWFEDQFREVSDWLRDVGHPWLERSEETEDSLPALRQRQQEFRDFSQTVLERSQRAQRLLQGMSGWDVGVSPRLRPYADQLRGYGAGLARFSQRLDQQRLHVDHTIRLHQHLQTDDSWSRGSLQSLSTVGLSPLPRLSPGDRISPDNRRPSPPCPQGQARPRPVVPETGGPEGWPRAPGPPHPGHRWAPEGAASCLGGSRTPCPQRRSPRPTGPSWLSAWSLSGSPSPPRPSSTSTPDVRAPCPPPTPPSRKAQSFELGPGGAAGPGVLIRGLEVSSSQLVDRTCSPREHVMLGRRAERLAQAPWGDSPEVQLPPRAVFSRPRRAVAQALAAERHYVSSLELVTGSYVPDLDRPDVPAELRGKKGPLFGNLEKLLDFHRERLLPALEASAACPLRLGERFLAHREQFSLYAHYVKNKLQSDALLAAHGNIFFKRRQLLLRDRTDLAAHLLKPVQRMISYGLLLRELAGECGTDQGRQRLQLHTAADMVDFQLRHGHDLLAMDSIRGCDVSEGRGGGRRDTGQCTDIPL